MEAGRETRVVRGAHGGSRWEMAERAPCGRLAPFVRRLVGYDERSPGPRRQRQFPGPSFVLIVELGEPLRVQLGPDPRGAARHPGGFAGALGDAFAITEHAGAQRGIQVDLAPTGARRLLGLPLSELAGGVVALGDLLPAEHRVLCDRLHDAADWASRLDRIEALLARRILGAPLDTARVDRAVARIEAAGGNLDLGALARELGCSHKHLIALFHDQVGVPPGLLARLVRLERVLRRSLGRRPGARAGAAPPVSWADLAAEHGYCDQAHLAREVRRFTGLTPTQARVERSELADLFG